MNKLIVAVTLCLLSFGTQAFEIKSMLSVSPIEPAEPGHLAGLPWVEPSVESPQASVKINQYIAMGIMQGAYKDTFDGKIPYTPKNILPVSYLVLRNDPYLISFDILVETCEETCTKHRLYPVFDSLTGEHLLLNDFVSDKGMAKLNQLSKEQTNEEMEKKLQSLDAAETKDDYSRTWIKSCLDLSKANKNENILTNNFKVDMDKITFIASPCSSDFYLPTQSKTGQFQNAFYYDQLTSYLTPYGENKLYKKQNTPNEKSQFLDKVLQGNIKNIPIAMLVKPDELGGFQGLYYYYKTKDPIYIIGDISDNIGNNFSAKQTNNTENEQFKGKKGQRVITGLWTGYTPTKRATLPFALYQ